MRRSLRLTSFAPMLALALAASLASRPALAQEHTSATVRGWVRDAGGAAIQDAEVLIMGTSHTTRSGDAGAFRIDSVRAGRYSIGVRRLGYEPLVFTLTLRADDSREFDVRLDALPQGLPTVQVVARSDFPARYRDFERRRKSEWGWFYTRDDIERQGPYGLSQLVARHWIGISPMDLERGYVPAFSSFDRRTQYARGRRACIPSVSVNGGLPMPGWGLGDFSADEVEAMEIYRPGLTRVPMELTGAGRGGGCGVVVLWLR